ncbi:hypothetical protein F0562_022745 [Nyssa sinensis]|uniref:Uncharacterized protein n=1 Tax=Nyssa sinensis TaxID=561372 RepID=A0A5J5BEJ7_9ASTE|nr:hypothetical protein F0562_022745 [Nyssa sinensis]
MSSRLCPCKRAFIVAGGAVFFGSLDLSLSLSFSLSSLSLDSRQHKSASFSSFFSNFFSLFCENSASDDIFEATEQNLGFFALS